MKSTTNLIKSSIHQNKNDNKKENGLTIIELLIAIPIATMIIVVIFGTFFTQYTAVLAESSRSNLRSSGQTLLINMQDELLFTIAYGERLATDLNDPSAPSGGWKYNTSPQTLIINEIALDSTRRNDDRHIIRKRTNNCEASGITDNSVALNNVIYFIKSNPDSKYKTLYKRTITPTYNLCSIDKSTGQPCTPTSATCLPNAKKSTCPKAVVGVGNCTGPDSILSENVINFEIEYYAKDNVQTTFPSPADKIEVVLTLGDTVYGKEVETSVRHTIRKIN